MLTRLVELCQLKILYSKGTDRTGKINILYAIAFSMDVKKHYSINYFDAD
ncbi:MAG: hypothetical protein V7K64_21350 [Nostoc sp.]|nr:hypothetical protein [Nostoc sp. JL34]MBN3885554.1 hypothetical protein [Nostoc sp. JL34]